MATVAFKCSWSIAAALLEGSLTTPSLKRSLPPAATLGDTLCAAQAGATSSIMYTKENQPNLNESLHDKAVKTLHQPGLSMKRDGCSQQQCTRPFMDGSSSSLGSMVGVVVVVVVVVALVGAAVLVAVVVEVFVV